MAMQANAGDIGLTGRVAENEKQIARLQGSYEHVATKADIADVRTEMEKLRRAIEKLRAELTWRILLAMSVFASLVIAYIEWRVVGG